MSRTYAEEVARARALPGSIENRLAMVRDAARRMLPAYTEAVDRFVVRLEAAETGADAPKPGDEMPDFVLPDQSGRLRSLEALRARAPLVVALHRGVWCSYCKVNLAALAETYPRIREAGGDLVAISPQRSVHGARHLLDAGAAFPMLADVGGGYAGALGLAAPLGDALATLLREAGIDFNEIYGDDDHVVPIPATFVVGVDGRVLARHLCPDPRRRMDLEEMVRAVRGASSDH